MLRNWVPSQDMGSMHYLISSREIKLFLCWVWCFWLKFLSTWRLQVHICCAAVAQVIDLRSWFSTRFITPGGWQHDHATAEAEESTHGSFYEKALCAQRTLHTQMKWKKLTISMPCVESKSKTLICQHAIIFNSKKPLFFLLPVLTMTQNRIIPQILIHIWRWTDWKNFLQSVCCWHLIHAC